MKALREKYKKNIFIIVHSATAARKEDLRFKKKRKKKKKKEGEKKYSHFISHNVYIYLSIDSHLFFFI